MIYQTKFYADDVAYLMWFENSTCHPNTISLHNKLHSKERLDKFLRLGILTIEDDYILLTSRGKRLINDITMTFSAFIQYEGYAE